MSLKFLKHSRNIILASMLISMPTLAQTIDDINIPEQPLVLKNRGSFMVGGELVKREASQLSTIFGKPLDFDGHITVNQMYVEFMVPEKETGVPVVMLHGATLSGKTYDTTPDGRMGWYEYFVRQGHPVYVPDQVSRGRSGFDPSLYNDVRNGKKPATELPNLFQQSDEVNWTIFRIGSAVGKPFPDTKFPVESLSELSKQAIPDYNASMPKPNPNFYTMAALGRQLDGAVLMGHSETGALPIQAALVDPKGAKGLILVEPGLCYSKSLTDNEVKTLSKIPTLVVFGDHLELVTQMHGFQWKTAYDDCLNFIDRVNKAGGNAQMLYPPSLGIHGNSHMIMQDTNNLQIADLILDWIQNNL
ncbi:hypothetical protein BA894_01235 [Vibrio natriegens]|uniref:hypothetical protein n=1 Tax=Vibrio natriegens TaxID=691 RepID=UPI00080451FA|nr:hypothetical protein [Vibrio natriegens]ANQ25155.1 hypothetical protein BA894_01235 [Vibrio natriegens]